MLYFKLIAIFAIAVPASALSADLPALQTIFNFFGDYFNGGKNTTRRHHPKDIDQMTPEELGQSRGQCRYRFVDYVRHAERSECAPDDINIVHLLPASDGGIGDAGGGSGTDGSGARKPHIMVKCLQAELSPNFTSAASGTSSQQSSAFSSTTIGYENQLLMMSSVKEIVALLKPIGNATKRHEPGSCVLVHFYTPTSLGCAHVAPYANMLPLLFPTLRIAAIDAFQFPSFNTEFGIVGLPTLLLFHQGRPIVKFYSDVGSFAAFVTRHTGIKHVQLVTALSNAMLHDPRNASNVNITGPLPLQPVQRTDYILLLAWAFILVCLGNYFAKSQVCTQIVEMIKRNWRESEAQLEHN